MTVLAMIFMTSALISVTVLAAWCYYKVLTETTDRRPHDKGDP